MSAEEPGFIVKCRYCHYWNAGRMSNKTITCKRCHKTLIRKNSVIRPVDTIHHANLQVVELNRPKQKMPQFTPGMSIAEIARQASIIEDEDETAPNKEVTHND